MTGFVVQGHIFNYIHIIIIQNNALILSLCIITFRIYDTKLNYFVKSFCLNVAFFCGICECDHKY